MAALGLGYSLALAVSATAAAEPGCPLEPVEIGRAGEVVDAETLRMDDGTELRLVGALPPDRAAPGAAHASPLAAEARQWLHGAVAGRVVAIAPDAPAIDRRGRRLAQVFAGGPDGVWLQGELVDRGLALAYSFAGQDACMAGLLAREAAARAARRGLWAHGGIIRRADRAEELLREVGEFIVAEGRVVSVGERRLRTYVDFGTYWSRDFTVVVGDRNRDAFAEAGLDLSALTDRWIRVRGWLEAGSGPFVEATHPEQIEIVADR